MKNKKLSISAGVISAALLGGAFAAEAATTTAKPAMSTFNPFAVKKPAAYVVPVVKRIRPVLPTVTKTVTPVTVTPVTVTPVTVTPVTVTPVTAVVPATIAPAAIVPVTDASVANTLTTTAQISASILSAAPTSPLNSLEDTRPPKRSDFRPPTRQGF